MTNDDPAPDERKVPGHKPAIGRWIGFGVGAGIGSAALVAALLYASRGSKAKAPGKR